MISKLMKPVSFQSFKIQKVGCYTRLYKTNKLIAISHQETAQVDGLRLVWQETRAQVAT